MNRYRRILIKLSGDPRTNSDVKRYISLDYDEVIRNNLKVMDQSAFILARDFELPIKDDYQ